MQEAPVLDDLLSVPMICLFLLGLPRHVFARVIQYTVANAEWACKKSLSLTKYGAYYFVGKRLGLSKASFDPRKPYLPPKEPQEKWTVKTMQVLAQDEEAIFAARNGGNGAKKVNGVH